MSWFVWHNCKEIFLAPLGRLDEAEGVLSGTLERAKKSADELIQAEILSSMADVSRKQGDSDPLAQSPQAGLEVITSPGGHARWAARTYNNIGARERAFQ